MKLGCFGRLSSPSRRPRNDDTSVFQQDLT